MSGAILKLFMVNGGGGHLGCRGLSVTNCVKKGGLSVTNWVKKGGLSVTKRKKGGFQGKNGQKFLNISSNLSKLSKNPIFCQKLSLV